MYSRACLIFCLFSMLCRPQLVIGATEGLERFRGLVDPTMPLQLSLRGVDETGLGIRSSGASRRLGADYKLSAILFRGDEPSAIVNKQRVAVGESIDGAEVIEIQRDGVIMLKGIDRFRVALYQSGVKRMRPEQD